MNEGDCKRVKMSLNITCMKEIQGPRFEHLPPGRHVGRIKETMRSLLNSLPYKCSFLLLSDRFTRWNDLLLQITDIDKFMHNRSLEVFLFKRHVFRPDETTCAIAVKD